jgi:LuxR family transcriptional regulator, maltose regulon positive regulatory protein
LHPELIASKLYMPPLRPNLVARPRLIRLLQEGLRLKRKLTLVSAPAGFGKTTLVVAWLNDIDLPAAWLSLDESDNDLPHFLAYLAAALQQVDEKIDTPLLSDLQSPQAPAPEKVLTALLNEIALQKDPLLLVLDDVHLLEEPSVLKAIEFLLHHQPAQLHLALTTREDPALPLARLRARDQLTEIRAGNLRFTKEETGAFLRGVMGLELSTQNVAALEDRTEGWAAGLQLAALSMQRQADPSAFITDFSGSNRHILDYLTDEVLEQQAQEVRTFLLQTSLLERLSGPLCDALTGRDDSSRILAHLEAANLFVIPLDEERRWYRYHHLFSELLRSQLTRSQPELIPELHRRASRWYEQNGDIQAAVEHALQDPDLTQAAHLVEAHAIPRLYRGEVAMVVGWFERLPERMLEAAPMLCIGKAWALAVMHPGMHMEEVEQALDAADHALNKVKAGTGLRDLVAGHATSVRAFVLQSSGICDQEPQKYIALSQEAMKLLPEGEKGIRSVNAMNMGYGYTGLANFEAAGIAFKQTLEDGVSGGNLYAAIYGPYNLILNAFLVGRLSEALHLCETNIERFNRIKAGQNFASIGVLYILQGMLFLEYGNLAKAEPALTEGLDLIRWTGEFVAHIKGYTELARLRAIQGDRPGMLDAVKALEEIWPSGILYTQALRHRLSIRHWRENPQVRKDASSWLAQSGVEFDMLAASGDIIPINRINFECYINTAHVMVRLAKEKPGKHSLEAVHSSLKRHQDFSVSHGIISWAVATAIGRTLLYHAAGKINEALETLQVALKAAAPTGLLRVFLDECDPLQTLLEQLKPRLTDESLIYYANLLLDGMSCGPAKPESGAKYPEKLSARELEVLGCLAKGLTYEEVGKQLYLSLNTIQFHVKNIYGKLLVNKRVQAIEKARAMHLI